jgi:hypothetical protein
LLAWTCLLLTLVPLALVGSWSQGVFAIGAGGLLKLRLLQGADLLILDESFAELDPESLRRSITEVENLAGTLMVVAHT